jgi:SAM-dependent methyltransferase
MRKLLAKAYEKTYIYKGDDPFSSHNRIAKLVMQRDINSILDVGCNAGFIGKALYKRGWRGKIHGVDLFKEYQSIVGKNNYASFQQINLETQAKQIEGTFDAIIFGDVLEHLVDPTAILKQFLPLLKPNGVIIISIPNIANIYIRLNLLFGRFEYTEKGILDRDHKTFFTLKFARKMLKQAGLQEILHTITPIPLPLVWPIFYTGKPLFLFYYLFYRTSLFMKTLMGYQFVFVACQQAKTNKQQ